MVKKQIGYLSNQMFIIIIFSVVMFNSYNGVKCINIWLFSVETWDGSFTCGLSTQILIQLWKKPFPKVKKRIL